MKKETIVLMVAALLAGLIGGYLIFSLGNRSTERPVAGGDIPVGAGSPNDYQQRITEAEKVVAREPRNFQAWVQLGNDYFDTGNSQKAIEAYSKALAIKPDSPDVLTDQGIMYRKVGWFDKAIANFEQAQRIDSRHLQSLYNLGAVYAEDLKQPDKALKAWSRYLEIDSTSPTAQQVQLEMEQLKTHQNKVFRK